MSSKLDTAANIAIIALVLVVGAVLVKNHFLTPAPAAPPGQADRVAALVGQSSEQLAELVSAHDAERMLVLAVAPGCHFCTESMPFYKRLIEERDEQGAPVAVVAAVADASLVEGEQQVMSETGVSPDGLVTLDFPSLGITGTPTVLLVDRNGEVQEAWIGQQQAPGEDAVIEAAFG